MTRRIADLSLTEEALFGLLSSLDGRARFRLEGVPPGCRLVGVAADDSRRAVRVRLEGEALDAVPDGEVVPRLDARLERVGEGLPDTPEEKIEAARGRDREFRARFRPGDHQGALDAGAAAAWDRHALLDAYDAARRELARLAGENARLRSVFRCDFTQDSEVARLAYEQGWADAQGQRDLAEERARQRRLGVKDRPTLAADLSLAPLGGLPYPDVPPEDHI